MVKLPRVTFLGVPVKRQKIQEIWSLNLLSVVMFMWGPAAKGASSPLHCTAPPLVLLWGPGLHFTPFASCLLSWWLRFLVSHGWSISFRKHTWLPPWKSEKTVLKASPSCYPKRVGLLFREEYSKHVPKDWNNPVLCTFWPQTGCDVRWWDLVFYHNQVSVNHEYKLK